MLCIEKSIIAFLSVKIYKDTQRKMSFMLPSKINDIQRSLRAFPHTLTIIYCYKEFVYSILCHDIKKVVLLFWYASINTKKSF